MFRSRLVEHGQERYAFNRLIRVGREAGFLPDKITVLVDSMAQHGAGAVQDTYTLIRKGIRRVLKVAGYALPAKKRGVCRPTWRPIWTATARPTLTGPTRRRGRRS